MAVQDRVSEIVGSLRHAVQVWGTAAKQNDSAYRRLADTVDLTRRELTFLRVREGLSQADYSRTLAAMGALLTANGFLDLA